MAHAEWGSKRTCPSCGGRFYDLGQNPATCPKCRYQYDPAVPVRSRRGKARKITPSVDEKALEAKRKAELRKKKSELAAGEDEEFVDLDGLEDIEEIEEVDDDIEALEEIREIDDREESPVEDETDEESLLEELDTEDNVIVDTISDDEETEEEEEQPKPKGKRK